MDYIITESQLKVVLENRDKHKLSQEIKSLWSFTKNITNTVRNKYNIDFKLLLTWGASVGGLVVPLDNYIRTGDFNLNDDQIALILFGCASTIIFDNERIIKQVINSVKDEGILNTFEKILKVAKELKTSFIDFLLSLNMSIGNIVSLIRYSFLIPIIPDLMSYINNDSNLSETVEIIVNRILASGVLTISVEVLRSIIKRSLTRMRG
jgi:hypothetical protein